MTAQEVLSEIQRKLHVPKSRENTFGKYNYRNAEDILDAVKKLLPKGASIVISDEIILIGDRYYVKAKAELFFEASVCHTYGWAREADNRKGMDVSQLTGSTSSYARKYAMAGLFAIDDGLDADCVKAYNRSEMTDASYLDENRLIKFGKFKGKKFGDVPTQELKNYIQWLTKDNKPQSPMMTQFINDSKKQIILKGK